ncbi:MAG TPA: hypothetical protein VFQ35_11895 [Polyangiaceae bacterium]|nr:hypothetical protein [Polyangiaceae bacterium]
MRWFTRFGIALGLSLVGCGGSSEKPPESPSSNSVALAEPKSKPKPKPRAKKEPATLFPQRCTMKRGECLPPAEWVNKLCDNIYPDLALHFFAPKTPWQRLYMTARADPFNASGGMSLMGDKLEPGEEVIALRRRDATKMQSTGENAGYDVLRWNGACATIHDDDFTEEPPSNLRSAPIDWRRLSVEMRNALEAIPEIGEVYELRHQKCRGKSVGIISDQCELYDKKLSEVVAMKVRSGAKLPQPKQVP